MTDIKPEYEIASDEAKALFESLGLTTQISAPIPDVRDNWPNILYRVTFSKNAANLSTEYRLGVGHVKIPKGEPHDCRLSQNEVSALYALQNNSNVQFKDKSLHARLAAKLAFKQKVAPQPFEVLAAICDDGQGAHAESFDNWCANFGSDPDSIKAKRIYETCVELYHQCAGLIGAKNVAKFAELHSQF